MEEQHLVAIITAILMGPEDRIGKPVGADKDRRIREWVEKARDIVRVAKGP